ncbi:Melanoma inhibitory activity protein 3 [Sciurus carolinensis]|uniref:Melanoma inhibitory activity protein 3 n=1 Tax=Sciurus carolinensis TaxID=30640 RepID=A0AA41MH02_SCICA|nr:Melanoma inhibitory activity protein 3 [Sciurus carolinensis]
MRDKKENSNCQLQMKRRFWLQRKLKLMSRELKKWRKNYRKELSFKNQSATYEKKAHDNWLKACAAERAIAEEKREAANLRHKLLEMTQKMAMRQDEPEIVKPKPGRPNTQNPPRRGPLSQNGSFGLSPWSSEASGKRFASDRRCDPAPMNSSSTSSSLAKMIDEGKVNMATKGTSPFPGVSLMDSPVGGPLPPPV